MIMKKFIIFIVIYLFFRSGQEWGHATWKTDDYHFLTSFYYSETSKFSEFLPNP